ncbi:hypothetical protein J8273_6686 [Carpediemonas membranifera]|uniref:Uncharacterized protein n=1 Tax=Carpediemonas membranifera TaxID=201153 RepID=A0A8J6DYE6_9EUKA|nr:hypothetical protein J8273_6686 [Carpediemonas membranifera]|eukprot:KAG9392094.1 hypothetical protein J8273_6686 [Carpediemonas membranifera]
MKQLDVAFDGEPVFASKHRPCEIYQDVVIPSGEKPAFIFFEYYYVASVAISFQEKPDTEKFHLACKPITLMQDPHSEADAYGTRIIDATTLTAAFKNTPTVHRLRLHLFQPSPMWASFKLTRVELFTPDVFHVAETHAARVSTTSAHAMHDAMACVAASAQTIRALADARR